MSNLPKMKRNENKKIQIREYTQKIEQKKTTPKQRLKNE